MASPLYRVQVALHRDGGMPEDDVVNTLHFEGDDDAPLGGDDARWNELRPGLVDRVKAFYVAIAPLYLSNILSNTCTLKVYNMRDPSAPNAPRYPRHSEQFTIAPAAGGTFPAEVALAISFRGALDPGVNPRRRTGRVFIGPLGSGNITIDAVAANDGRPSMAIRSGLLSRFKTMARGSAGSARLAIYSPTTDPGETNPNEAWNDAVTLWVDNSWDTIRKRGSAPTHKLVETF